eukprot:3369580-Amphidinium_carterae.1
MVSTQQPDERLLDPNISLNIRAGRLSPQSIRVEVTESNWEFCLDCNNCPNETLSECFRNLSSDAYQNDFRAALQRS